MLLYKEMSLLDCAHCPPNICLLALAASLVHHMAKAMNLFCCFIGYNQQKQPLW